MTLNRFRRFLYGLAKLLGDVQAVGSASRKSSANPIAKRAGRRIAGKITGKALGRLFR